VVRIDGTGRLFPPDRFFFHTGEPIVIEVTLAGTLTPNYAGEGFSLESLVDQARALLEGEAKG
jgi:hypothetical protein